MASCCSLVVAPGTATAKYHAGMLKAGRLQHGLRGGLFVGWLVGCEVRRVLPFTRIFLSSTCTLVIIVQVVVIIIIIIIIITPTIIIIIIIIIAPAIIIIINR